jgi:hypothetical protein
LGYDSGMNHSQKQEIRNLVKNHWDPRRGISPLTGKINIWVYPLIYVCFGLWSFSLVSGFVFLGFVIVGVCFFVYTKTLAIPIARHCDLHQRELCLWCQYSLTDLDEQGHCPECGGGYRKELCRELYRLAFNYDVGPNGFRQRIIAHKWLWARAIRERDRSRDE